MKTILMNCKSSRLVSDTHVHVYWLVAPLFIYPLLSDFHCERDSTLYTYTCVSDDYRDDLRQTITDPLSLGNCNFSLDINISENILHILVA